MPVSTSLPRLPVIGVSRVASTCIATPAVTAPATSIRPRRRAATRASRARRPMPSAAGNRARAARPAAAGAGTRAAGDALVGQHVVARRRKRVAPKTRISFAVSRSGQQLHQVQPLAALGGHRVLERVRLRGCCAAWRAAAACRRAATAAAAAARAASSATPIADARQQRAVQRRDARDHLRSAATCPDVRARWSWS